MAAIHSILRIGINIFIQKFNGYLQIVAVVLLQLLLIDSRAVSKLVLTMI